MNSKWLSALHMSVRGKLIVAFMIILLVPGTIIGWMSYQAAKEKLDVDHKDQALENVRLLDLLLTRMMEEQIKNVEFLSKDIAVPALRSQADLKTLEARFAKFKEKQPEVDFIYVGTGEGAFVSAPVEQLPEGYDPRKRPWYMQAVSTPDRVIVSPPYTTATSDDIVVTVAKVTQDGKGVVGIDLNLKTLGKLVQTVQIGNRGFIALYDQERKYLIHRDAKAGEQAKDSEEIRKLYGAEQAHFQYLKPDDGAKINAVFRTNPVTGWKLAGYWEASEAAENASPIFKTMIIVLAVAFLLGGIAAFVIVRSILVPLRKLSEASLRISQGDLSRKVELNTRDEFGKLADIFNTMVDSLRKVLHEVLDSSMVVASSAEQLSAGAEQTATATEHIANSIQQVSDGAAKQAVMVEESKRAASDIAGGAAQIAGNAREAARTAESASVKTHEGGQAVQSAVEQMDKINDSVGGLREMVSQLTRSSQEIGNITAVISEIAAQTNLLSLNAAIEAARAGEHGRGFAVVASEVKKLAAQSAESAERISSLIHTIQGKMSSVQHSMNATEAEVAEGLGVVQTAGALFRQIEQYVGEIAGKAQQVSGSANTMEAQAGKVVFSIEEIAQVARKSAAESENVSAAAEEQLASMQEISSSSTSLTSKAGELQELASRFTL